MMNSHIHIGLIVAEKKLQYKSQIDLRIRKKKSGQKKITGFQVIYSTERPFSSQLLLLLFFFFVKKGTFLF